MLLRPLSLRLVGFPVEIRQARADEIPFLKQKLAETEGEQIDLDSARVWVAIDQGSIVGMLSAHMCWRVEPLLIFADNKMTRRRAGLALYRAAESWLGNRLLNRTGIHHFFATTRSKAVIGWANRLGWFRQFRGAATFLKYL